MCMKSYSIRWIFLLFPFVKVFCYPVPMILHQFTENLMAHPPIHMYNHSDVRGQQTLLQHVRHQSTSPRLVCGTMSGWSFFELRFLLPREWFVFQLEFFSHVRFEERRFGSIMVVSRCEEDFGGLSKLSESKSSKTWKANNFMVSRLIASIR